MSNDTVQELDFRVKHAKRFLNAELTNLKTSNGHASIDAIQAGHMQDRIHEVERKGIRNLNEMDVIRLERVLMDIEKLSSN